MCKTDHEELPGQGGLCKLGGSERQLPSVFCDESVRKNFGAFEVECSQRMVLVGHRFC
jgi:hypothetical protein